ncbi:MAG: hypothetical protein LQ340_005388 [Diploschistes diacapsis]|nr:MAG: hypothetical protein LQ340_005388 [Diploschistes diacapsis]
MVVPSDIASGSYAEMIAAAWKVVIIALQSRVTLSAALNTIGEYGLFIQPVGRLSFARSSSISLQRVAGIGYI